VKTIIKDYVLFDYACIAAKAAALLSPIAAAWFFYPWVGVWLFEHPLLGPLLLAWVRSRT
jgi:hypothetical protein